jgi:hypothetical protein
LFLASNLASSDPHVTKEENIKPVALEGFNYTRHGDPQPMKSNTEEANLEGAIPKVGRQRFYLVGYSVFVPDCLRNEF